MLLLHFSESGQTGWSTQVLFQNQELVLIRILRVLMWKYMIYKMEHYLASQKSSI